VPLRVLHVLSGIDPADGGPTSALVALAKGLRRLNVDVAVVATPSSSGQLTAVDALQECGVRVRLGKDRRWPFVRDTDLRSLLGEEISRAEVVHIHALWEEVQFQAAHTCSLLAKPFIVRPCGLLDPWSMSRNRIKKRLYLEFRLRRYLDAASAIHYSTAFEADRTQPLGLRAPPIVEPNGFDFDDFRGAPSADAFRSRWNIPDDGPIVLFLGRLHSKKGLDLLIPAFADGAPADATLVIAGSGDNAYQMTLKRNVAAHGLANRVRFTGFLDGEERRVALMEATLFVLPSYSENFANTVVESVAAGTPVIVSDQVGIHAEVALSNVGGVVPLAAAPLAGEIQAWLGDASKRERAIANAGKFLQAYDLNLIAARWLARYRIIGQSTGDAAA